MSKRSQSRTEILESHEDFEVVELNHLGMTILKRDGDTHAPLRHHFIRVGRSLWAGSCTAFPQPHGRAVKEPRPVKQVEGEAVGFRCYGLILKRHLHGLVAEQTGLS